MTTTKHKHPDGHKPDCEKSRFKSTKLAGELDCTCQDSAPSRAQAPTVAEIAEIEQSLRDGSQYLYGLHWKDNCKIMLRAYRAKCAEVESRPTDWAYEQACKALEKHRQRADRLAELLIEIDGKLVLPLEWQQRLAELLNDA